MHILILAAGFGTRLQTYGESMPKGLIPTASGTLMSHVMDECLAIKEQVALVTNDRFFTTYTSWLKQSYPEALITVVNDQTKEPDNRKGAIGDIIYVLEELSWQKDDLLVVPSDTYFEFSLQEFIDFAKTKDSFATVVRDLGDASLIAGRLGCPTVSDGKITAFVEKPSNPPTTLAAIPFYYYPQSILSLLPRYAQSGGNLDAPGSIIPWLLSQNVPIYAFETTGKTIDVGTVADVEKVQNL